MIYLIKQEECIMMIRNLEIAESYKLMIFFWTLDCIVQGDNMSKKNIIQIDNNRKKLKIIIEMMLNRGFKL